MKLTTLCQEMPAELCVTDWLPALNKISFPRVKTVHVQNGFVTALITALSIKQPFPS
jgi:hypothetical protein